MRNVHRHHRLRRSQGGTDDSSSILLVSAELHDWIHRNVGLSYARGWLVHSWEDPAKVPVTPHDELRFECQVCECGGHPECEACAA